MRSKYFCYALVVAIELEVSPGGMEMRRSRRLCLFALVVVLGCLVNARVSGLRQSNPPQESEVAATQKRLFGAVFDDTVKQLAPSRVSELVSSGRADQTWPTKTKTATPKYKGRLPNDEIVVILEIVIDTKGIVRNARVLQSKFIHAQIVQTKSPFDVAAMETVSRWQYAPFTARGKPVPVLLTATVPFGPPGR